MSERGTETCVAPQSVDETPETESGSGEPFLDPHHARRTLQFIQRALRHGWDIPVRIKETAPKEILQLVESPGIDPRTRLRAIETLVAMDDSNTAKLLALAKEIRLDSPDMATEKNQVTVNVRYIDKLPERDDEAQQRRSTLPVLDAQVLSATTVDAGCASDLRSKAPLEVRTDADERGRRAWEWDAP